MREQRRAQRKRMRIAILGLFVVIGLITVIFFMQPDTIAASEPIKVIKVQVESGDSLWKIADKYDNNNMDLREYIYIIQRFNKLEHSVLQPGQEIVIPIYETENKSLILTSALAK